MTGRTHDLAAFTSLTLVFVNQPLISMSLATLITCLGANFLGALFPDLDNTSAKFWKQFRAGSLIAKLISPLLGGHRMISHSLLGLVITAILLEKLLILANSVLLVDMNLVWWSFMIGYTSHLATDALTREGIPLFFPLPISIGFPPAKTLRIKTGGRLEKSLIYPGLMLLTGLLFYQNSTKFLDFFRHYLH